MNRVEVDRIKSVREAMRNGRILVADPVFYEFRELYRRAEPLLRAKDVDVEGMVEQGLLSIDTLREWEGVVDELLYLCDQIGAAR